MSINRILCYVHSDRETAGYVRAQRTRRRALDLLERIPDVPVVELHVSTVESFFDGCGRVSWYFSSLDDDDALPFHDGTDLADLAAALGTSIRRHVDRLHAALSALEGAAE